MEVREALFRNHFLVFDVIKMGEADRRNDLFEDTRGSGAKRCGNLGQLMEN